MNQIPAIGLLHFVVNRPGVTVWNRKTYVDKVATPTPAPVQ